MIVMMNKTNLVAYNIRKNANIKEPESKIDIDKQSAYVCGPQQWHERIQTGVRGPEPP